MNRKHYLALFFTFAIVFSTIIGPGSVSALTIDKPLYFGVTGSDVSDLQLFLKQQGYFHYPTITGYYGSLTWKAVSTFQWDNSLEPVGYVGPRTRALIASLAGTNKPTNISGNGSGNPSSSAPASVASSSTPQCSAPVGLSCVPGSTSIIQPYAPGNGYTPGFGGGGNTNASPSNSLDTTPPSVMLTASSTVSGAAVAISATATDNVAIASVQFKLDGTSIGAALTTSPYSFSWDSTSVSDGTHTLYAVAVDTSGNFATSTWSITVDNTPPSISGFSVSNVNSTSAIIAWNTNELSNSQIVFGTTTSYGSTSTVDSTLNTAHSVTLSGLTSGTVYHVAVKSADAAGNPATSADHSLVPTYQGLVATRLGVNTAFGSTYREANTRSAHYARQTISGLKLILGAFYEPNGGTSEVGNNATTTYYASIEYPANTYTQVTFGGLASTSVGNKTTVTSDYVPLPTPIPNGAQFWVRLYMQSSGGIFYQAYGASGYGDGGEYTTGTTTNKTMIGGNVSAYSTLPQRPLAIIATTTQPSILIVGDSMAQGINETSNSSTTPDMGSVARWIGPNFAYTNVAEGGSNSSQFASSNTLLRRSLLPYVSDVMYELGLNDIFGAGSSSSTVVSAWQTNWAYATTLGKRAWQTTVSPEPSSTSDSWASAAGQTINTARNSVKNTLNNELRNGSLAGISGYFEIADQLENGRDSGLFITNGTASYYTTDGIHGTSAAYTLVQTALTTTALSAIGLQ